MRRRSLWVGVALVVILGLLVVASPLGLNLFKPVWNSLRADARADPVPIEGAHLGGSEPGSVISADRSAVAARPAAEPDGKMADITGPGISDRWGVTATDLGASILAPNGKLVSVFGDSFPSNRVGEGSWRSPVVLIGTGNAQSPIVWEQAGGPNPNFAEQLWFYVHDTTGPSWIHGGISTGQPSDLLRVGDTLYLHAMVNRGFPEVVWTEI